MTVGADPAEEKMIVAIIEANDPVKRFNKVCAVDHISPPGVVFGFLGPNGVGKTTTITGPMLTQMAKKSASRRQRRMIWSASTAPAKEREAVEPEEGEQNHPAPKIMRKKDGRTHPAYQPGHAVDLDTGVNRRSDAALADEGGTTTIATTLAPAETLEVMPNFDRENPVVRLVNRHI